MTHSYCQLMMLSKAAVDAALQSRPAQYQQVMDKAKFLYREHTRRSKGDMPEEFRGIPREALSLQSSVDADDSGDKGGDSATQNANLGPRMGGTSAKGVQLWQNMLSFRAKDQEPANANIPAVAKLSEDVADLKKAVKELLLLARNSACEDK